MNLKLYWLLGTTSRRAITRNKKGFGKPYIYNPRKDLINRLMNETGMSYEQVYHQLLKERKHLLSFYEEE